jgi:hypothetical protein
LFCAEELNHEGAWGTEIKLHAFLASSLVQFHVPAAILPGEKPSIAIERVGRTGRRWRKENLYALPRSNQMVTKMVTVMMMMMMMVTQIIIHLNTLFLYVHAQQPKG